MKVSLFRDKSGNCRGQLAEKYARQYLASHQLEIIDTNYKTPRGEIDIVAKDGDMLVFVEVRLRSRNAFGSASDSIDAHKRKRIVSAAKHYLQSRGLWNHAICRFDAICLDPMPDNPAQYQVEWIPAAFAADE